MQFSEYGMVGASRSGDAASSRILNLLQLIKAMCWTRPIFSAGLTSGSVAVDFLHNAQALIMFLIHNDDSKKVSVFRLKKW